MAASDLVNLSGLLDDAKCFALVRQHRWPDGVRCPGCDTGSGRWTRIEDSWVVEQRVGWCAMRRGGEPWRGLLII